MGVWVWVEGLTLTSVLSRCLFACLTTLGATLNQAQKEKAEKILSVRPFVCVFCFTGAAPFPVLNRAYKAAACLPACVRGSACSRTASPSRRCPGRPALRCNTFAR
eukprot:TRINITY_DN6745_c1_g1_i2.p1 TRINITY_DN6745_c1_g1~~TRINITY_DN6745_c1_g1_i2.p1  ORF type:complete len:106 (-),score=3.74 TRINITY_DN6745_c1_g1_i2:116-433(-)